MFKIEGTTITLTRGDSFYCTVGMTDQDSGDEYTPAEDDTIRFKMKRHKADSSALLEKEIPVSSLELHLAPEDTEGLAFGEYWYDIQITFKNGDVDTFIDEAKLILTWEAD